MDLKYLCFKNNKGLKDIGFYFPNMDKERVDYNKEKLILPLDKESISGPFFEKSRIPPLHLDVEWNKLMHPLSPPSD